MIHPSPATPLAHDPSNHDKALSAATRIQARYRGKKTRGMPITVLAARARAREDAEAGTSIMGTLKVMGISALKLIVYLVLGAVVYGFGEPTFGQDVSTTVIDSIYFSVATMSTVGYGDLSPTTTSMRVFTLFMIYGGIIFVFADISAVFGLFTVPITKAGRSFMEKLFPQVGVDLSGDGTPDYFKPRPPIIYYSKNLMPSLVLTMVVQFISAAVFCALEGWSYFDAICACKLRSLQPHSRCPLGACAHPLPTPPIRASESCPRRSLHGHRLYRGLWRPIHCDAAGPCLRVHPYALVGGAARRADWHRKRAGDGTRRHAQAHRPA